MVDLYCIRTYDTRMTFGDSTADVLLARYKWKKVEIPKPWTPSETGSKLTGFYGGKTSRQGSFGQYDVVIVHVPLGGARTVSGIQVLQLVDAAMIDVGDPILRRLQRRQAARRRQAHEAVRGFRCRGRTHRGLDAPERRSPNLKRSKIRP